VHLCLQTASAYVDRAIVKDIEIPTSAEPAVDIGCLGNLRRALRRREQPEEIDLFVPF
jgi:hypothetical protein